MKRSRALFLPPVVAGIVFLVVASVCGTLYVREAGHIERRIRDREAVRVGLLTHLLESGLQTAAHDLGILASDDDLLAFLASNHPSDRERAIRLAVFISQQRPDYDQIRYLDAAGSEVIRVNQGGAVVPAAELQGKSNRPYFDVTMSLDPGEVFVSAFDLNVENGRIEEPFKPMLRLAQPLFDLQGQRRGVAVINVLGQSLLSRLQEVLREDGHRLRLLNAEGYWLQAATPADEWGFMVPEREGATLARTDARLWADLATNASGQSGRTGGLLTWQRISPRGFVAEPSRAVTEDDFLIVASEISADEWSGFFAGLRQTRLFGTLALLGLAGVSGWFFRGRQLALEALRRSEENLSVTLHSIGDAVLATDTAGRVTRMNPVAEKLTGWSMDAARDRPISEVFQIINEESREPAVIPVAEVLATGETRGLANHTVLIARDGTERAIADSAAPIRDAGGRVIGVVLVFRDVTAEQTAARALHESEVRYRTLFNSIDEGFCVIEMIFDARDQPVDYRFLETNQAFERQTGLREAQGRRMRELAPGHEAHWFEIYGRIATTGEPARFQNRAEQLHRTFDVYAFRFGAPENRHVAILFSDITQRQKAEEELNRFFTLSLDFLGIASVDGYFKRVSPAVTDILGWSVDEFLAQPFLDLVHPDDHAATLAEVDAQITSGKKVLKFENRYRHKDGSWRVLSWRSAPQPGGLMYAIARDVTERKNAEDNLRDAKELLEVRVTERTAELAQANESLRHSERRFRALIEHGSDSVALIDENNLILYLSPAVTAVEGYRPEELLGRSGIEHTHPDDLPVVERVVRQLIARPGEPIPVLWRRRHKDGRWLWLEGVATNLLHDPAVRAIVTNYRDVTDRKRAEDEIRELNTRLEERVRRRTAELESANRELESFSYSVSHDLRAPLRHIHGYVEMLTAATIGHLSEKAQRYLSVIAAASMEMGQLIDDLLAFSRTSRTVLQQEAIHLDGLVQETVAGMEMITQGRTITWQIDPLPAVQGDRSLIKQVLSNLIGNAVKYSRHRTPAVIAIGQAGEENGRVIVFVRDNGAGFDMKYAHKLFGVFQRLHSSEEFEGTGIGLATVQRIINRHGGRVWAEAAPDLGATLFFTLQPAATP